MPYRKAEGTAETQKARLMKHHNNQILKALKAAHGFNDEQLHQIWTLGGVEISKSASAYYFKGPNHKNYRVCSNELAMAFIDGYVEYFRKKA